uniref:Putative proline-rich extensin-like protein n=1 Tax=Micrococcus sp. 28 TaxID=161213 RepID=Q8VPN4_9MICC|nr:putative proline-rich extensin-like protein [Micrococcus sp. 28]
MAPASPVARVASHDPHMASRTVPASSWRHHCGSHRRAFGLRRKWGRNHSVTHSSAVENTSSAASGCSASASSYSIAMVIAKSPPAGPARRRGCALRAVRAAWSQPVPSSGPSRSSGAGALGPGPSAATSAPAAPDSPSRCRPRAHWRPPHARPPSPLVPRWPPQRALGRTRDARPGHRCPTWAARPSRRPRPARRAPATPPPPCAHGQPPPPAVQPWPRGGQSRLPPPRDGPGRPRGRLAAPTPAHARR